MSPLGAGRQLQQGAANSRLQQLLANSQPATLRISPVLQLQDSYLSTQQAAQLRDVLVPGAVRVLQQYIKVRLPASRPVKAVREPMDQYCGEANADAVFKGAGFSGADSAFYVTAKKTGSCGANTIAYTIICHMEPFTYRPNVAAINLCPRFWELTPPAGSKQVSALVHEMIHGLGFSDRMFPFLYDATSGAQYEEVVREHTLGAPLASSAGSGVRHFTPASQAKQPVQFQDAAAAKESADGSDSDKKARVLFLVTPRLAAFAREYYGCASLPGAPADALTAGSHWRQAVINHELMQPASAEDSQRKRISGFTLNFLEDSGWYVTDKSGAQELEWGRGAGCGFVLDGCSSYASSNAGKQPYYCSEAQASKDVCTYDSRGIGSCSALGGTGCFTARADAARPLLYCEDASSFSRAGRTDAAAAMQAAGGAVGSPSSRCFNAPQRLCTTAGCSGDSAVAAMCAAASCDGAGRLFVELKSAGGKAQKLPCKDGATLNLPQLLPGVFKSGQIICPPASKVCPTLGCVDGCLNGYCWQGRCHCHLEFTGASCTQSLVPKLAAQANWRVPL